MGSVTPNKVIWQGDKRVDRDAKPFVCINYLVATSINRGINNSGQGIFSLPKQFDRKVWIVMRLVKVLVFAACVLVAPRIVSAAPITGNGPLGDFIGTFDYDPSLAKLIISLTNTSAASNGGYITALAFNNPGDVITGVTFNSTESDFALLGYPGFTDEFGVSPFGSADVGASATGNQWLGGGKPRGGITVGQTATFSLTLRAVSDR